MEHENVGTIVGLVDILDFGASVQIRRSLSRRLLSPAPSADGIGLAVRHLMLHGHHRIGYVGDAERIFIGRERYPTRAVQMLSLIHI